MRQPSYPIPDLSPSSRYYTYDADGNNIARTTIATGAVTWYQWNNANQLTAVEGAGANVTYAYDAFGRMVSRTADGATENYVYDGESLALVLNSSGQVIEGIGGQRNRGTQYQFLTAEA